MWPHLWLGLGRVEGKGERHVASARRGAAEKKKRKGPTVVSQVQGRMFEKMEEEEVKISERERRDL